MVVKIILALSFAAIIPRYTQSFSTQSILSFLKNKAKKVVKPSAIGLSVPILSTLNKKTQLTFNQYRVLSSLSGIGYSLSSNKSEQERVFLSAYSGTFTAELIRLYQELKKNSKESEGTTSLANESSDENNNKDYSSLAKYFGAGTITSCLLWLILARSFKQSVFYNSIFSLLIYLPTSNNKIKALTLGLNLGSNFTMIPSFLFYFLLDLPLGRSSDMQARRALYELIRENRRRIAYERRMDQLVMRNI